LREYKRGARPRRIGRATRRTREGITVNCSKIILAALLAASAPLAAATAEDFKIGTILPLTGPGADIGRFLLDGAKATVIMVNASGGIGGMHVEMTVCDTQSVEQQAVLCARRLTGDKVNLLLGGGTTPQTLAIIPTVEAAGIPLFAIAGGTINFRPLRKWVFKALATNEDQIPAAVDYLKAKGVKRIAAIRDNGPFGTDVGGTLKPYLEKVGVELVDDELYAPTDTDMTAQVTHVRAAKPDAIFDMSSNPPPGALVGKKIAQLGMNVPIVVGTNLQTLVFANLSGDAADQMLYIGLKMASSDAPESGPLAANIEGFRKAYHEVKPNEAAVSLSASCADAILLTQVAAKPLGAKSLDGETLLHALEGLKNVPGVQGVWTFSATSHESSLRDGIQLMKYSQGKWLAAK
jgi:branched-chain amino acid transport system substrate-binding protein